MKIAFLYAGQGSQKVGMGKDLYEAYPAFRAVMDRAGEDASIGFDVRKICFEGPDEMLNETKYTQPCMVAFAAGLTKVLEEAGIRPEAAAGLSLGEYSALFASGVLEEDQVIRLVAFRGAAMQAAAEGRNTKMIAVLGLDADTVIRGCEQVRAELTGTSECVAEPANFNCPGQITVSGDAAAVDRAAEVLKEMGAKKCIPVKVSGPFHTSLMKPAGDALAERFRGETFRDLQIPVYFNALGNTKSEEDTVPALLEAQVQKSVYFEQTLRRMAEDGVDTFVEIGPGHTLTGFVGKTLPEAAKYSVETAEEVENLIKTLKGEN